MTEPKPKWPLKANQQEVLQDLVTGMTQAQVAAKYGASREATARWVRRHLPQLTQIQSQVESAITEYAITDKKWRMAQLQSLHDDTVEWQAEHGLSVTTQRYDGKGNIMDEKVSYNSDLVRTRASLLRQAAEELDQLPRAGANIDNRIQILIREVNGVDPERLG